MGRDRAARDEAKPLRLFCAVDISDSAAAALDRALEPWRARLADARWVSPENLHITLKFLGRTWPRLVSLVEESCAKAATEIRPFRVSIEGLGAFPSARRARVFWAGLKDEDGSLPALARALEAALEKEFPPEKRGFSPHLTLARFNPPVPLAEYAEEMERTRIDAPAFRVGELVLYRSHLSPRGARYEAIGSYPFVR